MILRNANRTQYLPEYYARRAISLSLAALMFDICLREEESKEIDELEEAEGILYGPSIVNQAINAVSLIFRIYFTKNL